MTRPPYTYAASVARIVDADTLVLNVDLVFSVHAVVPVRILGWNAPEKNTPDGQRAIVFVQALIASAASVMVQTEKDEQTFARWLGKVYVDGEELGQKLADNGLAVRMDR